MAQQQARQFPLATVPVQEGGWLSPSGAYYPCSFGSHHQAAMEVAGVGPGELEVRGWVHISDSQIVSEGELTQPQLDTLFDMYMVNPESSLGRSIAAHVKWQE